MKFTLSWLKEHLDTDASLEEITDRLTAIGLELEGVENPADALAPFKIAEVLSADPHPNADKLQLLSVDDGSGKPWQVVCGAPNARAGMKGVFGPPGAYIPGSDFELKPAKIRGIESFGMMVSMRELALGDEHDGIIDLPKDAPTGIGYAQYAGLDDPVIDVAITPNRQDCMGVRGIARDLAASGLGKLKPLAIADIARSGAAPDIRSDDPEGCPAFFGCTVKGVTNGEAPIWMQKRLKAIGQKPISALVDITNYVMIDLGRPLHVYDADSIKGALVARKAQPGEMLVALNDKQYSLDAEMTVLADDQGAHDIGGIMGGMRTATQPDTKNVLIECAYFTPEHIARTGQKLALSSDARQRFERGVDPAFLEDGLAIATQYITDICGGTASEIARAGEPPIPETVIAYPPAFCAGLGGINVDPSEQKAILTRLGFEIDDSAGDSDGDLWQVRIPSWRRDIEGKADLVEEIIRITGLEKVQSVPLPRMPGIAKPTASPAQKLERKLSRSAANQGLNEAINWSFISEKEAAPFGGGEWILANPISEDLRVMRPSLLPGLIAAAKRNLDRGANSVRLFEIGRRYFKNASGDSDERATLGLLLAGEQAPRDWQNGKAPRFSPYDIKGEVENLLAAAGAPIDRLMVMPIDADHYHPGQSASLRLGPKNILARFGALHPATAKAFGIKPAYGALMVAEIHLDAIAQRSKKGHMRAVYAPPVLQAVKRDFAFIVDEGIAAEELLKRIRAADKVHIVEARIFDCFIGDAIGEGKKSLALEVALQPGETSFTEEQLQQISDNIIKAAAKIGAELRG